MVTQALHLNPAQVLALKQALVSQNNARKSGQLWAIAESNLRLARWHRDAGALDFALGLLQEALAVTPGLDQRVELLCESVNVLAQQSRQLEAQDSGSGSDARELARGHIFEATGLTGQLADPCWEAKVLLHLSDVLARFGDHGDAVKLQNRALRLMGPAGGVQPKAFNPHVMPDLGRLADG
jgi:tetratricopeptide (TPR) repeat protein